MTQLLRHIRRCNDAELPGRRLPVRVSGHRVGYVLPDLARQIATLGAPLDVTLDDTGLDIPPHQLQPLARALAGQDQLWWRDEPFDVRATPDGPVLGQIDRGALPLFGIRSCGVHLNGLVGDHLWVGYRAPDKKLDPNKLDHMVAGGIPAGHTPEQTLLKEGKEEASLPKSLLRHAKPVATLAYATDRDEGLRRDTLYCYDLELPPDIHPVPGDGEVTRFELWPLPRVLDTVRHTDDFKFNVNLVLIDLFLRRSLVAGDEAATLRCALDAEGR